MTLLLELLLKALIVISIVFLLVGLFKSEWIWFWKRPLDPLVVVAIAGTLFMTGFTGIGAISQEDTGNSLERELGARILSKSQYRITPETKRCDAGGRLGHGGATDDEISDDGIRYSVRTPINYDASIAHPLLMVYSPYGRDRGETERFTYLTREATAAGFIVSYVDHERMAPETLIKLGAIPRRIVKKWCVDEDRVYFTGHSDGGSIAMGLAFINGTRDIPAAIAPSAAGITGDDVADRSCPKPISVMIMHSSHDTVFPGYGKSVIGWWAHCNKCSITAITQQQGGCIAYGGCANGVKTWYCENAHPHPVWPGTNSAIIGFLTGARRS